MSLGHLFVISAPSGTGKTTVVQALRAARPALVESVSYSTRQPRAGEVHGRHYYFTDAPTFHRMAAAGEFLEWAEVHGHLYGTPRAPIEIWRAQGRDVLLDIDVQGGKAVKAADAQATLIFLLPPSMDVLAERLRRRGTDDAATVQRRLAKAADEIAEQAVYDHVVTNHTVDETVAAILAIMNATETTVTA
ncbi:MAG: guanylate kinase [Deltaproteobacteria bacterium]|nr:guanylate kinase [Deltaproteobacteria bacterium]